MKVIAFVWSYKDALFSSLMVSLRFITSKWILALMIREKKLFPYISRAINLNFVRFDIIYKKRNNLLNKIMNKKGKKLVF
jgi:hypothetical protein